MELVRLVMGAITLWLSGGGRYSNSSSTPPKDELIVRPHVDERDMPWWRHFCP